MGSSNPPAIFKISFNDILDAEYNPGTLTLPKISTLDEDSPTSLATIRSPLFKNTLSLVISTFKLDIMSSCDFLSLIGLTVSIVMTEEALGVKPAA